LKECDDFSFVIVIPEGGCGFCGEGAGAGFVPGFDGTGLATA
jgi:hypothetical protein